MRFVLFDRVLTLEKGSRIVGRTAFGRSSVISGGEGRAPIVPASMLVEAMVQLLGWAVIHGHDFRLAAIVCLIEGVTVSRPFLAPGVAVEVGGEIISSGREDSLGRTWIDLDGRRCATINRVIYRHFLDVDASALRREFRLRAGSDHDISTTASPSGSKNGLIDASSTRKHPWGV